MCVCDGVESFFHIFLQCVHAMAGFHIYYRKQFSKQQGKVDVIIPNIDEESRSKNLMVTK